MEVINWRTTVTGLLASASLVLVGCGSDRVGGVTSPSTVNARTVSAATSNLVVAFDHGNDGDEVEGEAPVTSLVAGTSCPTLSFMIGSLKVSVTSATQFERGTCATIQPGVILEVKGTKVGTAVTATKIEFESVAPPTPPTTPPGPTPPATQPVEGEGMVTGLTAGTACPTLQFTVSTFTVKLTATTTFEHGVCTDIKVGVMLEVTGTMDTATHTVTASKVELKNENEGENEPAEGDGVVTSLVTGTSCPTLQFMVGTFLIKLDANTVFDKGTCADIQVGMKVHVKGGMNRTTSSVLATRIAVQTDNGGPGKPDHPVIEGDAHVTSLMSGTACPTLTFRVDEWTVMVDATTTFVAGTCADIKPGRHVGVKGVITAEHTVQASFIVVKSDD
ncbi:MAG TPA: DUF5666 domain-containing protein [Vicinamibacterales bacterium]|nr:DUF5666 domain-containing protein [Vicinamibacterales bacterium]